MTANEALEITTFRLTDGLTAADFIEANEDIDAYLRRQPGFRWRRIAEADNGTIIDIVAWDSVTDADHSSAGIMTEMIDSPVHATIDHATVDFRIAAVLRHMG
jgi:hypothetical protein